MRKLNIANWDLISRLKKVDYKRYINSFKKLDGGKKLVLASFAALLMFLSLEAVTASHASILPTNVHEADEKASSQGSKSSAPDLNAPIAYYTYEEYQGSVVLPEGNTDAAVITEDDKSPEGGAALASKSSEAEESAVKPQDHELGMADNDKANDLKSSINGLASIVSRVPANLKPMNDQIGAPGVNGEKATDSEQTANSSSDKTEAAASIDDMQDMLQSISDNMGSNTEGDKPQAGPQPTPVATQVATPSPSPTPELPAGSASQVEPTPQPTVAAGSVIEAAPDMEPIGPDIEDETAMNIIDIVAIPPAKVPGEISQEEQSIEAFIAVALEQVGKPYVRGGKGPNNFDCSGFVYYALNTSGYKLNYMTSGTWAQSGFTTIGSIDEIQRGDIICLRGHVAIYMGDGIMVDASSRNGKIVVRDVGGWCRRNFINAKRIWDVKLTGGTVTETNNVKPKDEVELGVMEVTEQ